MNSTLEHIISAFKISAKVLYERKALRGLMETLNKDDLLFLRQHFLTYILCKEYDQYGETEDSEFRREYVLDLLKDVIELLYPNAKKKTKNKTIGYLLKQYETKRNNEDIKQELMKRYDYQSYNVQKKIIATFICTNDNDARHWAYYKLNQNWDNCFLKDIKRLWELYHEKTCGILVIRHLPKEYVIENQEALGVDSNYIALALRLYKTPGFVIEKERFTSSNHLDIYDYIYVMAHTEGSMDGEEVLRCLFKCIVKEINATSRSYHICRNMECFSEDGRYFEDRIYASTKLMPRVGMLIDCMGKMGLAKELVYYMNWDMIIQQKFQVSWQEYLTEEKGEYSTTVAWDMLCEHAKEHFPMDFKYLFHGEQPEEVFERASVNTLSPQNPALLKLIEQFGLEETEWQKEK